MTIIGQKMPPCLADVTVIIPSFNHERYIGHAIASVLEQTHPNVRLIILDDGSSDRSVAVIDSVLSAYGTSRARLITQRNLGAPATLNRAVGLSETPYVAILNSDDYYAPTRLARMLQAAPDEGEFMAFSGVRLLGVPPHEAAAQAITPWYARWLRALSFLPTAGYGLLLFNYSMSSSNFVFSRSLFERVGGFDPALDICHDWAFLIDALALTEPIFVPELLLNYRFHTENTSRSRAHLGDHEGAQVMAHYALWAGRATANPLAPSHQNWPRYMPFFCGQVEPLFSPHRLKHYLPDGLWDRQNRLAERSGEAAAIRKLYTGFLAAPDSEIAPLQAMALCSQAWSMPSGMMGS